MEKVVKELQSNDLEQFIRRLDSFCQTLMKAMKFPELDADNLRNEIWAVLFDKLTRDDFSKVHGKCLAAIRILSRDKTDLNNLVTNERLGAIVGKINHLDLVNPSNNDHLEAIKLLCNLIYNSEKVQSEIINTPCLPELIKTIKNTKDYTEKEATLFEVRVLFLITALNNSSRRRMKDLGGDECLINMLNDLWKQINQKGFKFLAKAIETANEILKTLFNLYLDADDSSEEEKQKHKKLAHTIYILLSSQYTQNEEELHNHCANLFTVIPFSCCDPIIQPVKSLQGSRVKDTYRNMDMTAINVFLDLLDTKLSNDNNNSEISICLPVLTTLLKLSRSIRLVRKHLRQIVLPPLKDDVMTRPEEGSTLKAKLCQKLTSPVIEFKDLVAEFLFVLCKENVGRMIKYTGYGNAAGMFANKGLLGCNQPETEYSSDSGDSDTEEYAKYKDGINPVTGCYEKSKPNPFENMSEEQKEHEAMKLVNLISQLTNAGGIVRPCTIGEDGKPKPVEHILELQEGLKRSQINQSDSE